jgi:hypothetical protein
VSKGFRAPRYLLLSRLRVHRIDTVSMRLYDAGDARVELSRQFSFRFLPAHRSAIHFRRSPELRLERASPIPIEAWLVGQHDVKSEESVARAGGP